MKFSITPTVASGAMLVTLAGCEHRPAATLPLAPTVTAEPPSPPPTVPYLDPGFPPLAAPPAVYLRQPPAPAE